MFVSPLFYKIHHGILYIETCLEDFRSLFEKDNFVLRMFDFGWWWSMTLKNRIGGGKKRLRGGQRQKARAVVWQWVHTFKEAVPPGIMDLWGAESGGRGTCLNCYIYIGKQGTHWVKIS